MAISHVENFFGQLPVVVRGIFIDSFVSPFSDSPGPACIRCSWGRATGLRRCLIRHGGVPRRNLQVAPLEASHCGFWGVLRSRFPPFFLKTKIKHWRYLELCHCIYDGGDCTALCSVVSCDLCTTVTTCYIYCPRQQPFNGILATLMLEHVDLFFKKCDSRDKINALEPSSVLDYFRPVHNRNNKNIFQDTKYKKKKSLGMFYLLCGLTKVKLTSHLSFLSKIATDG